jgi:hypothetical protein
MDLDEESGEEKGKKEKLVMTNVVLVNAFENNLRFKF